MTAEQTPLVACCCREHIHAGTCMRSRRMGVSRHKTTWRGSAHLQVAHLVKGLHVQLIVLLRRQLRCPQLAQHGSCELQRLAHVVVLLQAGRAAHTQHAAGPGWCMDSSATLAADVIVMCRALSCGRPTCHLTAWRGRAAACPPMQKRHHCSSQPPVPHAALCPMPHRKHCEQQTSAPIPTGACATAHALCAAIPAEPIPGWFLTMDLRIWNAERLSAALVSVRMRCCSSADGNDMASCCHAVPIQQGPIGQRVGVCVTAL